MRVGLSNVLIGYECLFWSDQVCNLLTYGCTYRIIWWYRTEDESLRLAIMIIKRM